VKGGGGGCSGFINTLEGIQCGAPAAAAASNWFSMTGYSNHLIEGATGVRNIPTVHNEKYPDFFFSCKDVTFQIHRRSPLQQDGVKKSQHCYSRTCYGLLCDDTSEVGKTPVR
jgi:hypothetical protein